MLLPLFCIYTRSAEKRPWVFYDDFKTLREALRVAVNLRSSDCYYDVAVCKVSGVPLQGELDI